MELLSNTDGHCPFCNSCDLEYDSIEPVDNLCHYAWQCNNCGHRGEEWYKLQFIGHNVIDDRGNSVEITKDMIKGG